MKPTTKMVWHIFKKDARLLWPFVLGAAGIQFALAGIRYMLDRSTGADAETLNDLYQLLVPASVLAAGFLIAMAVHQEAIPGVRQDWLVRPVRRRDLLLAKLLFVLAMVHGPIFVADTFQALVNGFPLGQSLASAATRGLLLLAFLSLPALAFASLTRNMTEAVIGGVLIFLTIFVVSELIYTRPSHRPATSGTGLGWMALLSMTAVLLVGAILIFTLQYFSRKTGLSRWLTVGIFCLALSTRFLPWQPAFALQRRLSPDPVLPADLRAVFDANGSRWD